MLKRGLMMSMALVVGLLLVVSLHAQEEQSSLTILKLVWPVDDGTVFPFTLEGPGPEQDFELGGGDFLNFSLEPGTYIVRELVPEDWELLVIRCGVIFEEGPVASGALQIELDPGESVTCRFENNMIGVPPPPPPGAVDVPTLSPTAVSIFFMALAIAGGLLLRKAI